MNYFQRKALEWGLKSLEKSSGSEAVENLLNRSIYSLLTEGQPVTIGKKPEDYVLEGHALNVVVYSVIDWIAGKAAEIEAVPKIKAKGNLEYYEPGEEFIEKLRKPNATQTGRQLRKMHYSYKLATGNAYLYSPRLFAGKDVGKLPEIHSMPSHLTEIVSGGWTNPVRGYKLKLGLGHILEIESGDVMHDKSVNLKSRNGESLYGMSPLEAAAKVVSKSNQGYTVQQKSYNNSGIQGFITPDGQAFKSLDDLGAAYGQDQASDLERGFNKKVRRSGGSNRLVFTPVPIKYHQVGSTPIDLGILEDMRFTLADICNAYHVSSKLFNDAEAAIQNNMNQYRKGAYTDAILPLVNDFYEGLSNWIGDVYGKGLVLDPDLSEIEELQEDRKQLAEVYNIGVENGSYTREEFRLKLGDDPGEDPTLKVHTVKIGTQLLSDVVSKPDDQTDENLDEEDL